MCRMPASASIAALLLLLVPSAAAHEYWIEASSYRPTPNSVVRLTQHLGERFAGQTAAFDPDRAEKYALHTPTGEAPIVGRSGGHVEFGRVGASGAYIVSYRSRRTPQEMSAPAFEAYLNEEGLAHIVRERASRGEQEKAGREVFSRCAKALLAVGIPAPQDREVGLTLEIVIEGGIGSEASAPLTARVLYDARPLAGAKVVAASRSHPERLLRQTADENGRVSFDLPEKGVWMLTTIHMVRAPKEVEADWESLWASSTFEIPAAAQTGQAPEPPAP